MDKGVKRPKFTLRNWECGIICGPEQLGFDLDSFQILKHFMDVERALPLAQVGRPWILGEN